MMKRDQIHIRDPFILAEKGKYYLYGSTDPNIWAGKCKGFSAYVSEDLENFSGQYSNVLLIFGRKSIFGHLKYIITAANIIYLLRFVRKVKADVARFCGRKIRLGLFLRLLRRLRLPSGIV